jgi:predicted component of type VI protein secretion system
VRNRAKQLQRDAVRQLTDELGVSVRDAATALDISFQRVAQRAGSATKQATAAKRAPVKAAAKQHTPRKKVKKVAAKAISG